MDAAEPPSRGGTVYPPADLRRRALARGIDTVLSFVPLALLGLTSHPVAGALCAVALSLTNDRLFGPGRSLGKRVAGLRCIELETRQPSGITASMKRNAALALALLPAAGGDARGLWLAALALTVVTISETVAVLAPVQRIEDLGRRRIGDFAAGTQVIDASIALGLPVAAVRPRSSQPALSAQQRPAHPPAPPVHLPAAGPALPSPSSLKGTACASH